jgi:hypothetical protein
MGEGEARLFCMAMHLHLGSQVPGQHRWIRGRPIVAERLKQPQQPISETVDTKVCWA